ncbi:MAG TPA: hypothetical protein VG101_03140 [Puia sp.]|nr:hypothetical protein [Puia sp.]
MPISLSYNSNGLFPLRDAGWVGLGWNLNAGGSISRTVEGNIDGIQNSGYNYGQYNLYDSIWLNGNVDSFLQRAYNPNLAYGNNSYDMAPDIFDAEFNGIGDKFFWINGKAYLISYNKELSISWPSPTSNMVITTEGGVQYTFGAKETTTNYYYGGPDSIPQSYTSSWYLTQIISLQGDTIEFNYTSKTWKQALNSYQTSYALSTTTGQSDLGYDPNQYLPFPSITTQVLQSIVCRNSRVSFVLDPVARTDVNGTLPRLREIDVIDSLTSDTVKRNFMSYRYFGASSLNPQAYERLELKTISSINPEIVADSLTYTFKYINEFDTALNSSGVGFPPKYTRGTDYWGYYNGAGNNSSILPPPTSVYYNPAPPSGASFSSGVNKGPNTTYSQYGLLDTIVNPSGGYTAFQYQQNTFYNSSVGGVNNGPGLCLLSTSAFDGVNPNPVFQKNYAYLQDNGSTTSGILTNVPNYNGPTFSIVNSGTTTNYNIYAATNTSGGIGSSNPVFYYSKVTESITSNGETHKTDHYFTEYPELVPDIRETESVDYLNTVNTNVFTPIKKTISSYTYSSDTSDIFTSSPYMGVENLSSTHNPKVWYSYGHSDLSWSTYWVRPTSQQVTQYDVNGDSLVTTTNYFFNTNTRNLTCSEAQGSDGETVVQKYKYPEDYVSGITGNMVSKHVLAPVIERQTWLKQNSSDSLLISGSITQYNQSIFKPDTTYAIETTSPIESLSNETTSGGLYSSLLSDAHYVRKEQLQYDGNTNLSVATKASDIPVSYIWDYRHSNPIAEVSNASPADIAYTSFEADGTGGWTVKGGGLNPGGVSGINSQSMHNDTISKSGLTSTTTYVVSYWTSNGSAYSIAGTIAGYPIQGKRINGWSYFEHKITGQTSVSITGTGNIDELRLYPANAQMVTYTYTPLVGISTKCDADNRATYYQYDPFGRLKVVLDQDRNIIKTIQYHTIGETVE